MLSFNFEAKALVPLGRSLCINHMQNWDYLIYHSFAFEAFAASCKEPSLRMQTLPPQIFLQYQIQGRDHTQS